MFEGLDGRYLPVPMYVKQRTQLPGARKFERMRCLHLNSQPCPCCCARIYLSASTNFPPARICMIYNKIKMRTTTKSMVNLPIHFPCSFVYPLLHRHSKLPIVLRHIALLSHDFSNGMHSLKSANITRIKASIAWSHLLIHIQPFGMIFASNSTELQPAVNERGPVSKKIKIVLSIRWGIAQNRGDLSWLDDILGWFYEA